jgi:CheY-like chemotaxis protein
MSDILVIEPNAAGQETVRELLEPIGVTCRFVAGPDKIVSERIAEGLILMGGDEECMALARRLRSLSVHVPLVVLTTYKNETTDEEFYGCGFDAVIREPYSAFRFQQIIWNFLRIEKEK